jgi:hypothetical protein
MKINSQEMKTNRREIKTIRELNKTISREMEIKKPKNKKHLSREEEKTSPDETCFSRDGRRFRRLFLICNRRFYTYNTVITN